MGQHTGADLSGLEFYDYWSRLAREDPERCEHELREAVEKIIAGASSPEEMLQGRQLQWRIDMQRRQAKNPLDSHIRLSRMFWESFFSEDGFLYTLTGLRHHLPPRPPLEAQVLRFRRKQ